MRFLGCSINVSVLTSRQPLHSDEIRSNSDLIQLRAATMPCGEVAAPGLLTESVLRVPKLTSFSSICRTRSAETSLIICAMMRSRSRFALAGTFSSGDEVAEDWGLDWRGFCPGFWATAPGMASIRSAIKTFKDNKVRKRRSNIQFLNFSELDGNLQRF